MCDIVQVCAKQVRTSVKTPKYFSLVVCTACNGAPVRFGSIVQVNNGSIKGVGFKNVQARTEKIYGVHRMDETNLYSGGGRGERGFVQSYISIVKGSRVNYMYFLNTSGWGAKNVFIFRSISLLRSFKNIEQRFHILELIKKKKILNCPSNGTS